MTFLAVLRRELRALVALPQTYAIAAALTRGEVVIEGVRPADLTLPLLKLRAAGVAVDEGADWLRVKAGDLEAVDVVTLPYPGFPTDLQPQLMVLLTQAEGTSRVTENVFESRFSFVDELRRMGADVEIDGQPAGETPLANMTLPIGTHEITFRHPQLGVRKQTVVVKLDGLTRVTQTFQPGSFK